MSRNIETHPNTKRSIGEVRRSSKIKNKTDRMTDLVISVGKVSYDHGYEVVSHDSTQVVRVLMTQDGDLGYLLH